MDFMEPLLFDISSLDQSGVDSAFKKDSLQIHDVMYSIT